jgi:uncharacterized membrane protein HdeD (DUF308 family)
MSGRLALSAAALETLSTKWGWFVALGAALLALGIMALGDVEAVTLVSVVFIGAMMLVGGIVQIAHALMTGRGWGGFWFGLVAGIVYVAGGLLIMREPLHGSILITLFVLVALVISGVLRVVIALRHPELPGWWMLLIGGVASVALGAFLVASLPWSGLWVLGTLVAVELIVHGLTWLQFGWALRGARGTALG